MKVAFLTVSLGWVVLAAVGAFLFRSQLREMTSLRGANDQLREEVQHLASALQRSQEHAGRLSDQLGENDAAARRLRDELAALNERLNQAAAAAPAAPPRPQRIQAYLGREPLGQAWFFPARPHPDAAPGQKLIPPAVVLDASLRTNLTVYVTNVIENEVAVYPPSTVNYNYIPPRQYYYPVYYPAWNLRPQPPPSRSSAPSIPRSPVLTPGSGSPKASPWGSILSRPAP